MYKRTKIFDLNYYKFIGSWAWILHRLSGLALIFYLTLHIWVINTLTMGPEKFNNVTQFLSSPLFKLLEAGLWGVILYHAFNGIRVVIVDFFKGSLMHKKLFAVLIAIAFVLWALGSYMLISHIQW
ncbi:MAG: succinate dehydrogenase, cytochrome b556 subunit [Candidatus Aminicenantes bacterium]|jgi:succinate dehydrogenase / fumarate reductase cytochrome b subunit